MQAVVVESDWSIYEQVWALVKQEAEGKSPQLSLYDRMANQVADLKRELSEAKRAGYIVGMSLYQSGMPFTSLDDETQAALNLLVPTMALPKEQNNG